MRGHGFREYYPDNRSKKGRTSVQKLLLSECTDRTNLERSWWKDADQSGESVPPILLAVSLDSHHR